MGGGEDEGVDAEAVQVAFMDDAVCVVEESVPIMVIVNIIHRTQYEHTQKIFHIGEIDTGMGVMVRTVVSAMVEFVVAYRIDVGARIAVMVAVVVGIKVVVQVAVSIVAEIAIVVDIVVNVLGVVTL